ncbi:Fungalysin metallopeptidase-domain-containing protein [Geopyxis carbonaria]|nr:Fungalysin metallopeptidase-domain-containing protein [Geopyxis carbonaria]
MRYSILLGLAFSALTCTASARESFSIPEAARTGSYINSKEVASSSQLRRATGGDALKVATAHLKEIAPEAEFKVNGDEYTDADTGVTHLYFTQTLNGLKIENAVANVNLKKDGTVLSSGSSLVKGKIEVPTISKRAELVNPLDALKGAVKVQGYKIDTAEATAIPENTLTGNAQSYVFEGVKGVEGSPKADLVYYATDDGVKLTWRLETDLDDNFMITYVNAQKSDDVVGALDYVADATYNVYPLGVNDPTDGERELLEDPAKTEYSPNGWHSEGHTDTWGNNGIAQENWDGGSDYESSKRPDGGYPLEFDYEYNITSTDPKSYIDAAVTQLFYTSNIYHDLLEALGFTEVAGNFEEVNTGEGGLGGDAVQLNAQDGAGTNNANFRTQPDGIRPRMRMYIWTTSTPRRDGDFDQGIIIHEYTHGLSNRLTGGPSTASCLGTLEAGGMGEGWGDWFATAIRIKGNDTRATDYTMGDWAAGSGIRPYPYSTSLTTSPVTYSSVGTSQFNAVHSIGSVWATMLYEVLWNFEDAYGYQSDPFPVFHEGTAVPTHGRQLAMKLVLEGMKLQPCNPTFLSARDAIVDADDVLTGGENACLIWTAFAKRGLGADATLSGTKRTSGFSLPEGLSCGGEVKKVPRRFRA